VTDLFPDNRKDMFAHIDFCLTAKRQMLKAGDKAASKKCPFCEGRWHFVLAGPRNHIHGACDGTCKRSIME
jgi:hypothetical protein